MLVKMKQDQHYIAVNGAKKCAFAGDIVDIDPLFAKYINGKFDVYVENESQDEAKGKPLDRMNKDELITRAKELEIDLSDEQFSELKKAEIIELIQQMS